MCGNVNWSRRDTCNVCNHSKDAKIESRAGYVEGSGGGAWDDVRVGPIPSNYTRVSLKTPAATPDL
jgi:hypothetical protein